MTDDSDPVQPAVPAPVAPRPGRDSRGLFLPGHSATKGGRPRRPDLFCVARDLAERDGYDLREALWKVTQKLINQALDGDVQAARLVVERLTDTDPVELHVTAATLGDTERAARLEAILRGAAARRKEQNGTP